MGESERVLSGLLDGDDEADAVGAAAGNGERVYFKEMGSM
jgi:hypothetical protein